MKRSTPLRFLTLLVALACAQAVTPAPETPGPLESPEPKITKPVEARSEPAEDTLQESPVSVAAAPKSMSMPAMPDQVLVGLRTDQESIEVPCCGDDVSIIVGGRELAAVRRLVVEPSVEKSGSAVFRLQIAALRDEAQATETAAIVERVMDVPVDVVFDAGTGLYRIRAGRFADRSDADQARRAFAQHNFHDVWIASEQTAIVNPGLTVRQGEEAWVVRGRWLRVSSPSNQGIAFDGKRYRGDLLIYVNNRGTLNLINEVSLDDYLRGVVPREMGPNIFNNIDALKAQAIAARTYTLKNMGEFNEEGYDICATPRCQVYGGLTAEHELSDRAVLETSREVLLNSGAFADALYSSTCGGHTENVEVVFPLKSDSHLRGVPCLEAGVDRLGDDRSSELSLAEAVIGKLVPRGASSNPADDFAARLGTLARMAGLATPEDNLASLERREVQRFLASQLDLALDARLFVSTEDLPYLLDRQPSGWSEEDLSLAAYLMQVGMLSGPLAEPLGAEVLDRSLFHLAVFLRLLETSDVRYLERQDDQLVVRSGEEVHRLPLEPGFLTFRKQDERVEGAQVTLLPGDRVTLFLHDGGVLALQHTVDSDGVAFDRTSNMSTWTRFRSDRDLAARVAERYPGFKFEDFEVLDRGVSGRVSRLQLLGSGDSVVEVRGLPIRWTLDLPDTLFTARRLEPADRPHGWLFSGRGWGHGVGLCQVGSYGMSVRGHGYRDILKHYYRGVEVVRVPHAVPPAEALGR